MNDEERYVLYSQQNIQDLASDDDYLYELADRLGVSRSHLHDDDVWEDIDRMRESDLSEEVYAISRRFEERCHAVRPEWGDYALMVRGTSSRWDGISSGYRFYAGERTGRRRVTPFEQLCGDTGYDGVFKDCEITEIWEDRDGTLHVEGVHHDGRVRVACRAVAPDTEERLDDLLEWNGSPADEAKFSKSVADAWEGAVRADMAGCYGYIWPDAERARGVTPSAVAEAATKAAARESQAGAAMRDGAVEEGRKGGIGR